MDLTASLSLIMPEILLSVSGLVLLLVAGWVGDKASRAISVAACFVLGACFFLTAPAVCGGAMGAGTHAFGGLFVADAFAGFAKLMIYASAGAVLVIAPAFFERFRLMRADIAALDARLARAAPVGDSKLKMAAPKAAAAAPGGAH
ncbi:MAG: hypothetical protein ACXWIW_09890 [Croceibacterium sp.]